MAAKQARPKATLSCNIILIPVNYQGIGKDRRSEETRNNRRMWLIVIPNSQFTALLWYDDGTRSRFRWLELASSCVDTAWLTMTSNDARDTSNNSCPGTGKSCGVHSLSRRRKSASDGGGHISRAARGRSRRHLTETSSCSRPTIYGFP